MKRSASRRAPAAVVCALLLAVILLSAGCIQSLNLASGVEAGPGHTITMQIKMFQDFGDTRGTLAFRIPDGWTITSVMYEGAASGIVNHSASIAGYFSTTWEATPIDSKHNGHKAGYHWWAGYTDRETVQENDIVTVTILVDTEDVAGSFLLDFVTGLTSTTSPENRAANSDGATWEAGNALGDPPGFLLNQSMTLLPATIPTVLSSTPANGAVDVPVTTAPTVTFSEAMDADWINNSRVELFQSGSASHVAATVTYNATDHRATLQPTLPLLYGTTYELRVDKNVKDLVGHIMAADFEASFTTVAPAAPHWISRTPDAGAIDQPLDTSVTVVFDQDMNAATISDTSFSLKKSGAAAPLAATVSYSAATRTAILDPNSALEAGSTYEVTLTPAVQNPTGQSVVGAPVTWSFTTVPPPSPHWTVRIPDAGATEQLVSTNVTVVFDQDMNAATISGASFSLMKEMAADPVAATVSYSAATRTAILDPTVDLDGNATYYVTLTSAVQNLTGQSVAGAPIVWSFSTRAIAPSFADVIPSNPYYAAIQGMAAAGIIQGYPQPGGGSLFKPDDPVWRAQFAKMVVGALGLAVAEGLTSPFTDLGPVIPGNLYPHAYVAVAYDNEITTGTSATTFSPWDNISRAQVVTMVVRAVQNLHPAVLQPVPAGYANTWGVDFSPVHGPNARIAEYNGLLEGLPLTGAANDPWGPMSRGEVAQVLWNMMGLID